jgi:hypothetical protein
MGEEGDVSFNLGSPARGLAQRARRPLGDAKIRVSIERPRQVSMKLGVVQNLDPLLSR